MNKCWICNKDDADSGKHAIKKSVLDFIMGKPSSTSRRYVSRIGGRKNIPVASFRNPNFKFKKSICRNCNDTLTQPYDYAFDNFIKGIFEAKNLIIARQSISVQNICRSAEEQNRLALYFMKIFGCMVIHNRFPIKSHDFQMLRYSLLTGLASMPHLYLNVHRDLKKLAAKKSTLVAQFPYCDGIFITWTIDLNWISLILCYPMHLPTSYGGSWQLSTQIEKLRLGKLH